MTDYVYLPSMDLYQPDRRKSNLPPPVPDKRTADPIRTTSEQYESLRSCLIRREEVKSLIGSKERRARHLLVFSAVFLIALAFAASDFNLSFPQVAGFQITLMQIAAVAPLLICYLILYACHLGASQLRVGHECKILDAELQKFGGTSGYGVIQEFVRECKKSHGTFDELVASRGFHSIYWIHDAFVGLSVALAFGGAAWLSWPAYSHLWISHPVVTVILATYLVLAATASMAAPAVYLYTRKKKDLLLDTYLKARKAGRRAPVRPEPLPVSQN